MGRHQQKRGVNPYEGEDLFQDDIIAENAKLKAMVAEYKDTVAWMQKVIDAQAKDIDNLQKDNRRQRCENDSLKHTNNFLEANIVHLQSLLHESGRMGLEISFALSKIIAFAKEKLDKNNFQPIKDMLNKFLRYIGTPEEYEQLDSLDEEMERKAKHAATINAQQVTMNDTQVHGPMYDVNHNENVELGGKEDGEDGEKSE